MGYNDYEVGKEYKYYGNNIKVTGKNDYQLMVRYEVDGKVCYMQFSEDSI